MTIGLKYNRRFIAVAGLDGETFTFAHVRSVPPRRAATPDSLALGKYFRQLLTQLQPTVVFVFGPHGHGETAESVYRALTTEAGHLGIPVKPLDRLTVYGSFGLVPPRTRRELRQLAEPLWPTLSEGTLHRQIVLAEAAVTALVGQVHELWPPL